MVIKQAWKVNTQTYDDLSHFVDSFGQIGFSLFEQSSAEITPFLLDELKFYPPVPPNSRYQRTFKLRDGWYVRIGMVGEGQFKFEVGNDTFYAAFVVGSLAQARDAAARFQRDFHKAHGWLLATDTVTFWWMAFLEDYQGRFETELGKFGTFEGGRRARTAF